MKFTTTIAAACLAASTATALPVVVGEGAPVPAPARWGNPIIDHTPVPGTRRRSPTMHIIEKVPVPDAERREVSGHRPVVDHRPVDRRAEAEAEAAAAAGEKTESAIAKAFWGMPIIDHIPVPGSRRRRAEREQRRAKGFPVVDHKPVPEGN